MAFNITPEKEGAWQLRDTVTPTPVILDNNKQYIPSFLIAGEFTSQFVAVGIKVATSGENWRFGGHLAQQFNFPSSGYKHSGKAFFRTGELIINDVEIIQVPVITDQPYRLRFFPPTWFRDLRLQVWEYTEEIEDNSIIESIEILTQLAQILLDLGVIQDGSLKVLIQLLLSLDIPEIIKQIEFIYNFITSLSSQEGLSTFQPEGRFFVIN